MSEFTHLHLHTAYSLLDGAIRLPDLFPRIREQGMDAVAITDHGNMFGAIDFYKRAKEHGIKPIFGCETYVAGDNRFDRQNRKNHHLILLAKDQEGYHNLQYLNSKAYLEGFYYHPRIDKPLLKERSKGLFGLSACLGGEIAQTLMHGGYERAKDVALEYRDLFEADSFFLEIQPNGLKEQGEVNEAWRRLSRETGIGLVATGDCHYLEQRDARAHEILMCIQQGKTLSDPRRMHHATDAYYVKAPSEFNEHFKDVPEALENTVRIARACNVELELDKTYLPRYQVPEGYEIDTYCRKVAAEGLEQRFREFVALHKKFDADEYRSRLDIELDVIVKMGFAGYFLIVWDFIRYAKEHGIPVGPGRGSGAGSLVAYSLRITDLDPLPYHLLFERFLNPERVSMPDFDVDFCMNRRDEVIRYVTEKYGKNNVGQIVTMHQLKARGVIRDIARVMAIPYAEADKVAKLVPEPVQGKSPPIKEAIEQEPKLKELYQSNDTYRFLLDTAQALEGLNRHAGMHAAGVVISEQPLWEYVPCSRGPAGEIVTQFAKDEVEQAGLVKFDFLGLKTLTVIDIACALIRQAGAPPERDAEALSRLGFVEREGQLVFDINAIPLDDASVYQMIADGDTTGVFQLESSGFKELLKKLRPDCFEDIIAAGALYRPGPLEGGMVDDFIKRKHGEKRITYQHPVLAPILKETYGVIVYQEQVMQIARALAGYSLGGADLLRRAMGKKKPEVMQKEKAKFMAGAEKNQVDPKIADEVFELMAAFAGYGFNKSHSAAYGLVTYQTAFLKRHFPEEFMCGLLSCDKDDTDKIVRNVAEARQMGIAVLRPDINQSDLDFSVVQLAAGSAELQGSGVVPGRERGGKARMRKAIRFGLSAVKGVGEGAVAAILEVRKSNIFKDFNDFCEQVDARRCNKKVLEQLIKSGAFDALGPNRASLFAAIDAAVERAAQAQRDRESGQRSLFDLLGGGGPAPGRAAAPDVAGKTAGTSIPVIAEWLPKQKLAYEKEALGFYSSGHPVDRYRDDLRRFRAVTVAELDTRPERAEVSVGGMVCEYRERPLKSGQGRIAFFNLEDPTGQIEIICFSKQFAEFEEIFKIDEPLLITGTLVTEGESDATVRRVQLKQAVPLSRVRNERTKALRITLDANACDAEQLAALKTTLAKYPGPTTTVLELLTAGACSDAVLPSRYAVVPSDELLAELERLVGAAAVRLQ